MTADNQKDKSEQIINIEKIIKDFLESVEKAKNEKVGIIVGLELFSQLHDRGQLKEVHKEKPTLLNFNPQYLVGDFEVFLSLDSEPLSFKVGMPDKTNKAGETD